MELLLLLLLLLRFDLLVRHVHGSVPHAVPACDGLVQLLQVQVAVFVRIVTVEEEVDLERSQPQAQRAQPTLELRTAHLGVAVGIQHSHEACDDLRSCAELLGHSLLRLAPQVIYGLRRRIGWRVDGRWSRERRRPRVPLKRADLPAHAQPGGILSRPGHVAQIALVAGLAKAQPAHSDGLSEG